MAYVHVEKLEVRKINNGFQIERSHPRNPDEFFCFENWSSASKWLEKNPPKFLEVEPNKEITTIAEIA